MSVIIRLQNLPWSANALDIRQFFSGLNIPEGGVHIIGGELGDAFIAFSTDEDARQAFNLNGGKIKEIQIKLMLSSRTEMQKVIEAARNPLAAFMQKASPVLPALIPAAVPAPVPELIKRNDKDKDKRDRRRSRSRDRRDRSRERDSRERDRRDRRRRDRSRSRSRDRRDRRRRDRSQSKDWRSKDSDSKDQKKSEERGITTNIVRQSVLPNAEKDTNKPLVWANNVPVVQTPSILNTLLPSHLQQSGLILNYRNGIPNPVDSLRIANLVNPWNINNLQNESARRLDVNSRSFQDDLKAVSNIIGGSNRNGNFESNSRSNFNRPTSHRTSGFDVPYEKAPVSQHPPTLRGPHPLDRLDGNNRADFPERFNYDRSQRSERFERERQIIKDCCIELKPFYGGYGEIRKFFNGLFIHNTGIKFLNDEYGKRKGIVYIRFASPTGKERALERNGLLLRDFTVELAEITDETFDKAVDRYHPSHSNDNSEENEDSNTSTEVSPTCSCLAIEDLPLFTKEQDMLKIFADYPLQQILIVNKHRHLLAYVKFSTSDDARKASKDRANCFFEGKPLQIRLCSDDEYNIASREQDEIVEFLDDVEPEVSPVIETDCVSLSGLPKKTTDRDVSDFFSDVAIVPNRIHLISSNFGFIGQAYCEFPSLQDAQTALQKNGLPLGSGIVKVKPILRSEMETNIGLAIPRDPIIKPPVLPIPPERPVSSRGTEPLLDNKNYETVPDRTNYDSPADDKILEKQVDVDNYEMPLDNEKYDVNDVEDYEELPHDRDYAQVDDRNYQPKNDMRHYDPSYEPMPPMRNFEGPRFSRPLPPPLMGISRLPPRPYLPPPPVNPSDMAAPGCTLLMENVPYKAGLDEILQFFEGFEVHEDNVLRRYNDNGTPSGEAKVIFNSKEETYQAFRACNLQMLRERTIYLTMC